MGKPQMRDSWGNWINTETLVNTGGEQTVRIIGPFHVAHDTAGITVAGSTLVGVSAGAHVLRVWAIVSEAFNSENETALAVLLGTPGGSSVSVFQGDVAFTSQSGGGGVVANINSGTPKIGYVESDCSLIAVILFDPAEPTAGEADIYALIAEPA